jgi:multiple antibiotic resistance protein
MELLSDFFKILVPLLIIMDPVGNLPLFLYFSADYSPNERKRMAASSVSVAFGILVFFSLTGDFVLRFFMISLPAVQIAGGFIFFIYSLQMLRLIPSSVKTTSEEEEEGAKKGHAAIVPLGTPLLAGPGAITAVLVWRHGLIENPFGTGIILAAILASCLITFAVFSFASSITRLLGIGGIRVVTRLTGLLLSVIAVQFMVEGLRKIILEGN